ncbi:hypothetical protein BJ912DRAFT_970918 [Pholiota molesta]|nr:hypothetical protein BJ912DRAFT_970918 [Pholiota molesta]
MNNPVVDNVPPEKEIVIAFTGALSYGIYLLTLSYACDGWTARKRRNWSMITITLLYFSLTLYKNTKTLHDIINHIPSDVPKGKLPWTSTVICVLANMTALLADTALMYRCWVVYARRKTVLFFPAFLWVLGFICTILQVVNMSIGPGMILIPFWATTLLINIYSMSILMYRIWSATRELHGARSSGFLYFSTTIAHFVVWFTPNDLAIRIASEINIPTIGIAFNLILIRAGQNRARENTSFTDIILGADPKIIVDVSQETSTASSGTV